MMFLVILWVIYNVGEIVLSLIRLGTVSSYHIKIHKEYTKPWGDTHLYFCFHSLF
jgi:hypothetical protein